VTRKQHFLCQNIVITFSEDEMAV